MPVGTPGITATVCRRPARASRPNYKKTGIAGITQRQPDDRHAFCNPRLSGRATRAQSIPTGDVGIRVPGAEMKSCLSLT